MDGIENNTAAYDSYLPHEMIEIILLRLPVKSLLRFRSVCKQWKATISDPEFGRTHLRLSKNSSSPACLVKVFGEAVLQHVDFDKDRFRLISTIDYPHVKAPRDGILCHCDGLYLIPCRCDFEYASAPPKSRDYALWNPSRRSYKVLNGCPIISSEVTWISGICYDPSVKDYKVVIGDSGYNYAVFNCRNNSWSELKEVNRNVDLWESIGFSGNHAVSYKGSVYWICLSKKEYRLKIVYFDGRDEEFKNLCKLDHVQAEVAALIFAEDEGLCLFTYCKCGRWRSDEMIFMKKVIGAGEEEEGMEEVKVELPPYDYARWRAVWPLCGTHGNKIFVRLEYSHSKEDYLLYDLTKRSFTTIQNAPPPGYSDYYNTFPYVENLRLA